MSTLTPRQKQILDYIKSYIQKNGVSPTFGEIGRHTKKAFSTVHEHVELLIKKGFLIKTNNSSRGIEVKQPSEMVSVPMLGTIAAGQPIEAVLERETIAIPKEQLPQSGNFYALRVQGDSMIDEGIHDKDTILIKEQNFANNGDKVVALINGGEATLKTFYKNKGHVRLQPANNNYDPLIITRKENISIQGVLFDVIRDVTTFAPTTVSTNYTTTINKPVTKLTGYSIYNEEARRRAQKNNLPDIFPKLPNKEFDIIYADPPWHYNGKLQFDNSSKSKENINFSKKIFISSAEFKYPTLKTSELMKIPINKIAKNDCLLFMWTTNPHLSQAIQLGEAWGFEYKTVAFIWDKMNHNPGQYTLSNCELCLVFKKGRIPRPRGARNIQQLIRSPRGRHSEKPVQVTQAIEKMFPTQERIELFARRKIKGWTVWGLDVFNESGGDSLQ